MLNFLYALIAFIFCLILLVLFIFSIVGIGQAWHIHRESKSRERLEIELRRQSCLKSTYEKFRFHIDLLESALEDKGFSGEVVDIKKQVDLFECPNPDEFDPLALLVMLGYNFSDISILMEHPKQSPIKYYNPITD